MSTGCVGVLKRDQDLFEDPEKARFKKLNT